MMMVYRPWPSRKVRTLGIGPARPVSDGWHRSIAPGRSAPLGVTVLTLAGPERAVGILRGPSRIRPAPAPRGSR
jgi:hypothetical protein